MFNVGTDEQTIINVLGCRSNQQRQQLKITFKTLFGRVRQSHISLWTGRVKLLWGG